MESHKIKVTLTNGRTVTLKSPSELEDAEDREVSLVFVNGDIYHGLVDFVDDDGDICLCKKHGGRGIGLPYCKLMGWFYD